MERTLSSHMSGPDFLGWIQFQMFCPHIYLLGPWVHILWMSINGGVGPFEQVRVGQRFCAEELRVPHPLLAPQLCGG